MKEIGSGVYQVEEGDHEALDRLQRHVEEMVKEQRARLNAERGHAWWADVVFHVHDMITYTGILREHYDAGQLADAIIDTTTETAKNLLEHTLGKDNPEKIAQAWSDILFDAKALDDIARAKVRADPNLPNSDALASIIEGSAENQPTRH
jgi:hypothetical protein